MKNFFMKINNSGYPDIISFLNLNTLNEENKLIPLLDKVLIHA